MKKLLETNYTKMYNIFKKIPFYIFVLIVAASVVVGICDAVEWFAFYESGIVVWPILGIVAGLVNWLVYSVLISPIVVIADAKLAESGKDEV